MNKLITTIGLLYFVAFSVLAEPPSYKGKMVLFALPTCRAQLWSGRFRTDWTTSLNFKDPSFHLSFQTSVAWSHQVLADSGA